MPAVGIQLPPDEGLPILDLVALAETAERAGYAAVATGEVAGPEAFGLLGLIAGRTRRVELGTAVIPMSTRSVALAAMGFATLASAAPGRVFAGVGTSSPAVVEGWHGQQMPNAPAITREYLPALRRALAGDRLEADGAHVRSRGFTLTLPATAVPVVLAAINPRMLELAGELADGVLLTWGTNEQLAAKVQAVRAAAMAAGRDPAAVRTLAVVYAYAGPQRDQARERIRRFLGRYASLPTHRATFTGALDLEAFDERWQAGDRTGAAALIDDDVIDRTTAFGSPDRVAERVRELWDAGVELPLLMTVGAQPGDVDGPCATITAVGRALDLRAPGVPDREASR